MGDTEFVFLGTPDGSDSPYPPQLWLGGERIDWIIRDEKTGDVFRLWQKDGLGVLFSFECVARQPEAQHA
jgi:hypothetical protein